MKILTINEINVEYLKYKYRQKYDPLYDKFIIYALRSTAQLISYELILSSVILLVILITGN